MCIRDSCPAFGGVYKLAAVADENGNFIPKIKVSENIEKVTNPGNKTIFRLYDKKTGKIRADLIALADEHYDAQNSLMIFDPISTWKKTRLHGGTYTCLLYTSKIAGSTRTSPTTASIISRVI